MNDVHDNPIYVFENDDIEIDCQSSDPFFKCQWTRPDASSICAIFKDNGAKKCQNTLRSKQAITITFSVKMLTLTVLIHLNLAHFRSRWFRHNDQ